MLRTALKPRWLALLALVIVIDAAFVLLGLWQLSVAKDEGRREALEQAHNLAPVDLTTVLPPHSPFRGDLSNRPVTLTGSYLADRQIVVVGRRLGSQSGVWVVTPFQVQATGATIAVLRGFAAEGSSAAEGTGIPPTTTGTLSITGTLGPGESPEERPSKLPPGRYGVLDLARMVNIWPGDMYSAIVLAADESPQATTGLTRVPPPEIPSGMTARNFAYALQWWVFALFGLWMWWRMVREDHLVTRRDAPEPHEPPSSPGQDSPEPKPAGVSS